MPVLSGCVDGYVYGSPNMTVEQINNTTGTVTYLYHDQKGSTRIGCS
jgi:hypothetical protein